MTIWVWTPALEWRLEAEAKLHSRGRSYQGGWRAAGEQMLAAIHEIRRLRRELETRPAINDTGVGGAR